MKKISNIHLLTSHNHSLIHSHLQVGSLISAHFISWIHCRRSHMKKSVVFISEFPINCLLLWITWKTNLCIFKISMLNKACSWERWLEYLKTPYLQKNVWEKKREKKNIFLLYFRMFQSNSSWKKGMAREYSGVLSWIMSLWLTVALRIILHNPCLNPECSVISTLLTIFLMTYFHNQLVSTKEGFQMLQVSLEICFSHFHVLCIIMYSCLSQTSTTWIPDFCPFT